MPLVEQRNRFLSFAFAASDILVETDLNGQITFAAGATAALPDGPEDQPDRLEARLDPTSRPIFRALLQRRRSNRRLGPAGIAIKGRRAQLSGWVLDDSDRVRWTLTFDAMDAPDEIDPEAFERSAIEAIRCARENSKPLSILCRGFSDIDRYTQGFPDNVVAGRQQPFKLARKCLPGPYTFILNAGKDLPKVCLVDPRSKAKNCKVRKTVGVRVPNHPVTQALLARLDRPLLCGTVPNLDETYDDDNQDPVLMLDEYERKGLAFLVDVGVMHNPASTVIDLSSGSPKLIRRGAGDASMWVDEDEDPTLASDDEAWGF